MLRYRDVVDRLQELSDNPQLDFVGKSEVIMKDVDELTRDGLLEHIDRAGVIPESFGHDSTEEKLFAKYCDSLLARAFRELGFDAVAIAERADAADVIASGDGYSLVGDAKAFRLSRTAKNQKDFKVEALSQWRKGANYSCLVAPLYQYPSATSQIYLQAVRYGVVLLSYIHLAFLIRMYEEDADLRPLWEVPTTLEPDKSAVSYWAAIDEAVVTIADVSADDWEDEKRRRFALLPDQAEEQIRFWEAKKREMMQLPHDEAVRRLIKAMKIDDKIARIGKYRT